MKAVFGLFLTLLRLSNAGNIYCDGREDGAWCFAALGGTVIIQLMNSTSGITKYEWKNKTTVILKGTENNFTLQNRSCFIPSNGTVGIKNLNMTDSGEYTLNVFDSKGKNVESRTLQLIVQAPVSSVQLVTECLTQLEMKVSCLSDGGDSPQYSWTLDGHKLTDSELLSGQSETNVIILKQSVTGRLACSVGNQISVGSKEQNISACKEYTASETHCDGTEDGAQCFGALGGAVIIQLTNNISGISDHIGGNSTSLILSAKDNNSFLNFNQSRSFYVSSNGTVIIENLSRTDDGQYILEIFDSEGQKTLRTLHLTTEAPVSSVQLVSECLSQGQMKVSCLSKGGDSPQYNWSLNGNTLSDSELLSGHSETNIIILRPNIPGRLVCSVRNQVSYALEEKVLFVCPDTSLLIHSLLFVTTLLSCAVICLYFQLRKNKCNREFVTS
ncbi:hemicentin-1-like [Cyprinodon tularosa]|uniref:hemicentin-1-like n=1 Tax=Cyprinodon tularosa TaxID=77115 RepID=UPI0018E26234|nr:hemicentin-1-like [Cyprinodon tularosa]